MLSFLVAPSTENQAENPWKKFLEIVLPRGKLLGETLIAILGTILRNSGTNSYECRRETSPMKSWGKMKKKNANKLKKELVKNSLCETVKEFKGGIEVEMRGRIPKKTYLEESFIEIL